MAGNRIDRDPTALNLQDRRTVKGYDSLTEDKKKELKKLESACNDFESIFVLQMMKEMRKTVHKTGLTDGGMAEEIFQDMLDQERSKTATLGLGSLLFQQLSRGIIPPTRGNEKS